MKSTKILLSALLFATAISCIDPRAPIPICPISRWSSNYQNSQATLGPSVARTFHYNKQHQVIQQEIIYAAGQSQTITYSYNSKGQVISSLDRGTFEKTYLYDANGRMVEIPEDQFKFEYNSSGQLVKFTSPYLTYAYTYPNESTHNYSEVEYTSGSSTWMYSYEYDEKTNAFMSIPFFLVGVFPSTDNNIVSSTQLAVTSTFAYEYNDQGYPVSKTTGGLVESFEYDCN